MNVSYNELKLFEKMVKAYKKSHRLSGNEEKMCNDLKNKLEKEYQATLETNSF